jgi:hypothetical protein
MPTLAELSILPHDIVRRRLLRLIGSAMDVRE